MASKYKKHITLAQVNPQPYGNLPSNWSLCGAYIPEVKSYVVAWSGQRIRGRPALPLSKCLRGVTCKSCRKNWQYVNAVRQKELLKEKANA